MELSVKERLVILSVLPKEGDFLTLKILRQLRESLSFNEEETKTYKFVQNEGSVAWDDQAPQTKNIPIGEKANDIIVEALKRLNAQKKLLDSHFDVYEKFVGA